MRKPTNFNGCLTLIVTVILTIMLCMLLSSCSSSVYWHESKYTASGKHSYYKPGWGADRRCAGMYSRNPISRTNYRKYYYGSKHICQ